MDEMRQNMQAWSHRLRCQLDNSKLPADKQTNCADDDANTARYKK
jgi:hypothetical protein